MRFKWARASTAAAIGGALTLGVIAAPTTADAHPTGTRQLHVIKTLSSHYIGPLQFAVSGPFVVVADGFTSTLNLIGRKKPLAAGPGNGGDVAAVAINPWNSSLGYSTSNADHSATKFIVRSPYRKRVVADLAGFEKQHNPDGRISYGVRHPSRCASKALKGAGIPVSYRGGVDSHPYAATALHRGTWAVADAGGNDIVRVNRHGHVSTLSVLPRQALHVSADFAKANGLPACVVGITYYFESVPTDVERGPGGWLYATTLPGGMGATGSVYRINPYTGHATRIATGFPAATNLAVDPHGHIYVASLADGTISRVVHRHGVVVATLPNVVAVEWANHHLYASTAPAANQAEDSPSGPDAQTGAPSGPPPSGTVVILGC
jgi:hypothetical protein